MTTLISLCCLLYALWITRRDAKREQAFHSLCCRLNRIDGDVKALATEVGWNDDRTYTVALSRKIQP